MVNHFVQPWRSHSRGGGVLCEHILPALETSNARELVRNYIVQQSRRYLNRILLGDLIKKTLIREKERPLRTMYIVTVQLK